MVVSDKYKYVFIEVPHTGSTAMSKELKEHYKGKEVLYKHANYHEFLKIATPKQKKYFVFAGVRNPLDEATSLFNKFLTDHKSNYTDPKKQLKYGGWVTERKIDIYNLVQKSKSFSKFLRAFYTRIYTSNINVNKKHCDYIMRFENLNGDFSEVLQKLNITQKRELPKVNTTKQKRDFRAYYKGSDKVYAARIFGPFMQEWGYNFPETWRHVKVSSWSKIVYRFAKIGRTVYSKYIKSGPFKRLTALRNTLE